MKKLLTIISVVLIVTILTGCNEQERVDITLMLNKEEYKVFEDVLKGDTITLDIIEAETGMTFTGWKSETDMYYYDSIKVHEETLLEATFESSTTVFMYEPFEEDTVMISEYIGHGGFVTIPQFIDELPVTYIKSYAFENSNLFGVNIPIDAIIGQDAFTGSDHLEEIAFYGDFVTDAEISIGNHSYEDIISENNCTIVEGTEEDEAYKLNEGCPIKEVLRISETIVVEGIEYFSYTVIVDRNKLDAGLYSGFGWNSFRGLNNLKTLTLSKGESWVMTDAFRNVNSLVEIIVPEENNSYVSVDGVLYSKSMDYLVFYPQGKTDETYRIPSEVKDMASDAFLDNTLLKEIVIPSDFTGEFTSSYLAGLERLTVEEGNTLYREVDGVLFKNNYLVKYPAMLENDTYEIPDGIEMIYDGAFSHVSKLNNLVISNSVTRLGHNVFWYSASLDTLTLPETIEVIGSMLLHESTVKHLYVEKDIDAVQDAMFLTSGLGQIDSELTIYFPEGAAPLYGLANVWRGYNSFFDYYKESE